MTRRSPRRPSSAARAADVGPAPRLLKFRVWNGLGTVSAVIGVSTHQEVRRGRRRGGILEPRSPGEIIDEARNQGRSVLSLRHSDAIVVEPLDPAE